MGDGIIILCWAAFVSVMMWIRYRVDRKLDEIDDALRGVVVGY